VLIATTPRFVRSADWERGMETAVFDGFAENLADDAAATLQRFSLLQARGDSTERPVARRLRECAASSRSVGRPALATGLQILKETDLRGYLAAITQPVLIVHGDRDEVVPLSAGEYMQRALPNAKLEIMTGAAHAPFISNPETVARHIVDFVGG
jgi:pimeloyl-[acyl-carrier protein] methyl ester esterase